MSDHKHHTNLVDGVVDELREVLEESKQAVYVYLDDNHKACNELFAKMLGYNSPKDWASVHESFTDSFVDTKSKKALVSAYGAAMENLVGSVVSVNWKTKSGKIIKTNVILVPYPHDGHLFALHFISKK
jgi:hypothetical protein